MSPQRRTFRSRREAHGLRKEKEKKKKKDLEGLGLCHKR
jgi:hypothetical protein